MLGSPGLQHSGPLLFLLVNAPLLYFGDNTWPFPWVTTFPPSAAGGNPGPCLASPPTQGKACDSSKINFFLGLELTAQGCWEGRWAAGGCLARSVLTRMLLGPATEVSEPPAPALALPQLPCPRPWPQCCLSRGLVSVSFGEASHIPPSRYSQPNLWNFSVLPYLEKRVLQM